MPHSDATFDNDIRQILSSTPAKSYLDVGPGAGKYGQTIRQVNPNAHTTAVEADASYVSKFHLKKIYNEVHVQRIEDFISHHPGFTIDIAIIGDCLEHLKKSDGLDLIHYLIYRTQKILIVFPSKYIQYDWQGHAAEAHYSVWDQSDFRQFQHDFVQKPMVYNSGTMNLVIIQGYLSDLQATHNADQ